MISMAQRKVRLRMAGGFADAPEVLAGIGPCL